MTHRIIIGFFVFNIFMVNTAGAVLGADIAHFEALRLTRLDPAVTLPDMRVPDIEGQDLALRSFHVQVLLINFWTTW